MINQRAGWGVGNVLKKLLPNGDW